MTAAASITPAIADDPQTRREAGYVLFGDPPQRAGFGPVTVEIDVTAKMAERRVGKYILTSNGAIEKNGSHCDCIMLQIARVRFEGALICS